MREKTRNAKGNSADNLALSWWNSCIQTFTMFSTTWLYKLVSVSLLSGAERTFLLPPPPPPPPPLFLSLTSLAFWMAFSTSTVSSSFSVVTVQSRQTWWQRDKPWRKKGMSHSLAKSLQSTTAGVYVKKKIIHITELVTAIVCWQRSFSVIGAALMTVGP